MVDSSLISAIAEEFPSTPVVQKVLAHLCESDCHAFGDILEWCEARGDCSHAIVCPECKTQFVIDQDELGELTRWTLEHGNVLVCGIRWEN